MWINMSFWHSLNWLSLQHRKQNLAISFLSSSSAIDSTLFTISYCTFTTTTCKSTLRSMYKRSTLHVPPLSLVACLMLDVTRMLSRICWCQSPATSLLISFARKSRSETVSSSCCLGSKSVSMMVALTRMFTMPWPRFTLIQTTILSLSWRRTKWVVQSPRCVAIPFNPSPQFTKHTPYTCSTMILASLESTARREILTSLIFVTKRDNVTMNLSTSQMRTPCSSTKHVIWFIDETPHCGNTFCKKATPTVDSSLTR